jgi:hypothetical protein
MAAVPEVGGLEVAGGGGCEVESAVVGRPEELIEPEQSDTKLV